MSRPPKTAISSVDLLNRLDTAAKALELRKYGYSYPSIAAQLGISSGRARALVSEYVEMVENRAIEDVETVREIEVARLDRYQEVVSRKLANADPEHDESLRAIEVGIKLQERRSRLLGLDRPVQVETKNVIEQQVPDASMQAAIGMYFEKMQTLPAEADEPPAEDA